MKRIAWSLAVLAVFVGATITMAADDTAWLDWNCEICKNISGQEGLMDNMTWEHHVISNGMMAVSAVKEDYRDGYRAAMTGIDKTVARLQAGEELHLCGMCTEMGRVLQAGAVMDEAETAAGFVMLVTSSDAELAGDIQKMAARTNDEMAKMMDAGQEEEGHEGHGH